MSEADLEAARANAYAVSYRLIGESTSAHSVADAAAAEVVGEGGLDRPGAVRELVAVTVRRSVAAVAPVAPEADADRRTEVRRPRHDTPADDDLRVDLRRRFASATTDEQVVGALHHLSGYPLETVAAFVGRPVDEVTELASALAPAPGSSYRSLGDPDLIGRRRSAQRRHHRRPSRSTVLSVLVVILVVLGASRCVGARPTLGPAARRAPVIIGPTVAARPSTGCSGAVDNPGTFDSTAAGADGEVGFRLSVPPSSAPASSPSPPRSPSESTTAAPTPRALVVWVSDPGAPDASFAAGSSIEQRGLETGFVVASTSATATASTDLASIIREVLAHRCIDTSRVTVTGFGAGGQAATVAACAAPDLVAVAAPVAGASMPGDCPLNPPVSLLVQWNADDPVMPPTDGSAGVGTPASPVFPSTSAGRVARDWATSVGTGPMDRGVAADGTATEQASAGNGVTVRSVIDPSGGHTWDASNTAEVLDFAAAHGRAPL